MAAACAAEGHAMRTLRRVVLALASVAGLGVATVAGTSWYYGGSDGRGCARCHEIRPMVDAWSHSSHRNVGIGGEAPRRPGIAGAGQRPRSADGRREAQGRSCRRPAGSARGSRPGKRPEGEERSA